MFKLNNKQIMSNRDCFKVIAGVCVDMRGQREDT